MVRVIEKDRERIREPSILKKKSKERKEGEGKKEMGRKEVKKKTIQTIYLQAHFCTYFVVVLISGRLCKKFALERPINRMGYNGKFKESLSTNHENHSRFCFERRVLLQVV